MKDLIKMAKVWDIENNDNEARRMATGSERHIYFDMLKTLEILRDFKFEPYQPVPSPPSPDFMTRLREWIIKFDEKDQKYMFYLASKIIFITHRQMTYSMTYLFQKKLKKILLEDIIKEKNLEPFSYIKAEEYVASELKKTLFVGLTDSSRINDFTHVNGADIDRIVNTGIELDTLLYPSKRRNEYRADSKGKIDLITKFEKEILLDDDLIKNKDRLVILEDFSGTGLDIIEKFKLLDSSFLPFKKVIFAPYIITYKAIEKLEDWIRDKSNDREYDYTYGILIPKESMCFDNDRSYLKIEWHESIDICDKVKQICKWAYNTNFEHNPYKYLYGFGEIKIALANYYNCPDNSLPIIWYNKKDWKPLFIRASRTI